MTSWTHDATALAAALLLFPPEGDPSGLLLAVLCIGTLGTWSAVERARQDRAERRVKERLDALRERGVEDPRPTDKEYDAMRWRGPRKGLTRPLRLVAVLGAAAAALPIAAALAFARFPDQAEVGPIDHRKLTHYLVTAAALVYGARYGALQLAAASPHVTAADAEGLWRGFATGYGAHLTMDACTRSGVPLLWPLVRADVHLVPEEVNVRVSRWWPVRARRGERVKVAPRTGGPIDALVMLAALGSVVAAV